MFKTNFLKTRSIEPEIIDLGPGHYTIQEYNDFLYQLDRVNKYFGVDNVMLKKFSQLPFPINSILDVGCGGGSFAIKLANTFKNVNIVGIDIANEAITYAQAQQNIFKEKEKLSNLKFELRTQPELDEPEKSFDIITCSLVMHHLTDQDIIEFLKRSANVARKRIIINDLHRNILSYFGFSVCSRLFFRSRLICYDGLLSIAKSFRKEDWQYYLESAGFKNYKINWHWPFRWIVEIEI